MAYSIDINNLNPLIDFSSMIFDLILFISLVDEFFRIIIYLSLPT